MKSIYLTGFLLLNIFVVGQNYPFETMTVREGLPTNDVYAIAKDASGCMWFGCSNALVKYDGYRMESFTANDGMVASAVSALACDEDGNVWIGHGADGISVYRNGKFEKFAAKDAGQNFISALLAYDGYLYALQNKKSVRVLDMANGKEVSRIDSQNDVVPYCMARPSGAYNSKGILVGTDKGICFFSPSGFNFSSSLSGIQVFSLIDQGEEGWLAGTPLGLLRTDQQSGTYSVIRAAEANSRFSQLAIDAYQTPWVYDASDFSLVALDGTRIIKASHCTGGYSTLVNRMMADNEGNVWVAFSGLGLYRFYNLHVCNYSDKDGFSTNYLTTTAHGTHGQTMAGSMNGLFVSEAGGQYHALDFIPAKPEFIRQVSEISGNQFIVATSSSDLRGNYNLLEKKVDGPQQYSMITASKFFIDGDTIITGRWDGVLRKITVRHGFEVHDSIALGIDPGLECKFNAFAKTANNLLIATSVGLFRLHPDGSIKTYDGDWLGTPVNDITYCRNGRILICTSAFLYVFHSEADLDVNKFTSYEGHCFLSADEDDAGNIWAGTDTGLLFIKDESTPALLTVDDGLAGNNINDVHFDPSSHVLMLATTNGLSVLDPLKFGKISGTPLKLYLGRMFVNDQSRALAADLSLGLPTDAIRFLFSPHTYADRHLLVYHYRLNGGTWQLLPTPEISMGNWDYGSNEVEIKVTHILSGANASIEIPVDVYVPIYRREPVQAATGGLFLILAYAIFRARMERVRRISKQKIEQVNYIHQLRQQAVSASLNPHFIFNCLNSIQYFVNNGDIEKADKYLVGFSRLVRFNLDNGVKEFISLHDEIEYLRRYAELENLRLGGTLSFEFDIDPTINPLTTNIPTFIIQPFVENAFRHAFLQGQNPKTVSVMVKKDEDRIAVLVSDNGRGLHTAADQKDPDHRSSGIELVRQKLNLINDKYGARCSLQLNDKSEDGIENGTVVSIVLDGTDKFSRAA